MFIDFFEISDDEARGEVPADQVLIDTILADTLGKRYFGNLDGRLMIWNCLFIE